MRFFAAVLLIFSAAHALASEPVVALGDGETFKYRIAWGVFSSAGEVTIAGRAGVLEGLPQLSVATSTSTRGMIRGLYPFDGTAECTFDARDGRLMAARATTTAGKKKTNAMAVFDYRAAVVHYEDFVRPVRNANLPLPAGRPVDLLTCLVQTRSWDLKPGDRRPVLVMFDDDFYELTVVAQRYEKVKTPRGTVKSLVLAALMERDPKGMFKRGGSVQVWISQDQKRLPVKFEVKLPVGIGVAHLIDYQPPLTAAPSVADANPRP